MNREMRIASPVMETDSAAARLSAEIAFADSLSGRLWYSLPVVHADWLTTDRCDGFVVALLLQAMERNANIVTEAPMSSRLWHSLQHFYIPMMAQAFQNRHPIKIIPASLTNEVKFSRGVATGFSGGIDSFAVVVQHLIKANTADRRISHFLFNNVGSHGQGETNNARRLFRQRFQMANAFTQKVGISLIPVDSNLADIFPVDFVKSHSALNASIPLLLQNQFKLYYYASAYKYADCGVHGIDDLAYFDPLAMHLLSTESLDCVSTGSERSRVEKTAMVADYEPSYQHLNVCVDPSFEGRNCSVCFKCCRTLLTLELLGKADLYKEVFDLERFAKVRSSYIRKVIFYKKGSFEAEIAELARTRNSGVLSRVLGARKALEKLF